MTEVARGRNGVPELTTDLLEEAPAGSRLVLTWAELGEHNNDRATTIYDRVADGWLWRDVLGTVPVPSQILVECWPYMTWRLHHPGLVRVTAFRDEAGQGWLWTTLAGERMAWYESAADAGDDARGYIAAHGDLARAS